MIRIIRAAALAALRGQAARVPGLEHTARHADRVRAEAVAARVRAEAAQARAEALWRDTVAGLARLKVQAADPRTGPPVLGQIALRVLRDQIAAVKASGDADLTASIRVLDALIGTDSPLAAGLAGIRAPAQAGHAHVLVRPVDLGDEGRCQVTAPELPAAEAALGQIGPCATCRHCGGPAEECACGMACPGWRHAGHRPQELAAHYCGGTGPLITPAGARDADGMRGSLPGDDDGHEMSRDCAGTAKATLAAAAAAGRPGRDPGVLCDCLPGDVTRDPVCEYRLLGDAAGDALNPPDGDEAEVAILIAAVERIAAYVKGLPCSCGPGAVAYDDDPCGRCQALGQRCGKAEPR